jgi:hypothetical protein
VARARREIVRKAIVRMHHAVRNRMATVRRVIVRSMPAARGPMATARLHPAVRAPMAIAPARNRRSNGANPKTGFRRMNDA